VANSKSAVDRRVGFILTGFGNVAGNMVGIETNLGVLENVSKSCEGDRK
jgi:hypothetical protein